MIGADVVSGAAVVSGTVVIGATAVVTFGSVSTTGALEVTVAVVASVTIGAVVVGAVEVAGATVVRSPIDVTSGRDVTSPSAVVSATGRVVSAEGFVLVVSTALLPQDTISKILNSNNPINKESFFIVTLLFTKYNTKTHLCKEKSEKLRPFSTNKKILTFLHFAIDKTILLCYNSRAVEKRCYGSVGRARPW